jgi:hypothetical protein
MNKMQKIALAEKDLLVKDLGNILNKHHNYVSNVLSGRYMSPNLRKKIAEILEKSESSLWPKD